MQSALQHTEKSKTSTPAQGKKSNLDFLLHGKISTVHEETRPKFKKGDARRILSISYFPLPSYQRMLGIAFLNVVGIRVFSPPEAQQYGEKLGP
jgi:hypothetical protein